MSARAGKRGKGPEEDKGSVDGDDLGVMDDIIEEQLAGIQRDSECGVCKDGFHLS